MTIRNTIANRPVRTMLVAMTLALLPATMTLAGDRPSPYTDEEIDAAIADAEHGPTTADARRDDGKALVARPQAQYAAASYLCSGTLLQAKPIYYSGTRIGEVQIFYNSSTGNNCAVTMHGGPTWGVPSRTWVTLVDFYACPSGTTCPVLAHSSGIFSYRAGPISGYGKGRCIYALGGIYYGGKDNFSVTKIYC